MSERKPWEPLSDSLPILCPMSMENGEMHICQDRCAWKIKGKCAVTMLASAAMLWADMEREEVK